MQIITYDFNCLANSELFVNKYSHFQIIHCVTAQTFTQFVILLYIFIQR
jgi:hypothetical protein